MWVTAILAPYFLTRVHIKLYSDTLPHSNIIKTRLETVEGNLTRSSEIVVGKNRASKVGQDSSDTS